MIRAKADGGGEPAGPRNRVAVDHVRDLRPIGRQRDPAHRPRAGALQEFLLLERNGRQLVGQGALDHCYLPLRRTASGRPRLVGP
jgi:hypothetical protein